jgi:hypothetical protein
MCHFDLSSFSSCDFVHYPSLSLLLHSSLLLLPMMERQRNEHFVPREVKGDDVVMTDGECELAA